MRHHTQKHSADKPIFYAFLALFIWAPLPLGSNRYWSEQLLEFWVFALAAWWLILFALGRVSVTAAFRYSKPVLVLFGLWLGLVGFQLVPLSDPLLQALSPTLAEHHETLGVHGIDPANTVTISPHDTQVFFFKSLAYILIFCLALLLLRRTERIRTLGIVLVLSGTFQAVYGGIMTMSGLEWGFFAEKEHYKGVATGTFSNRNSLAGYLEMCLAVGIGMLLADMGDSEATDWRQRARNIVRWLMSPKIRLRIYLALMVIGLVLTRSRMGNTAFFSSLIIMGLLWLWLSGKARKKSTLIVLVSLFVIDIYIVGAWFGIDKVVDRLEKTSVVSETRDDVVGDSSAYIEQFSIAGSGGATFYTGFPFYRGENVDEFYSLAHNDYLQFSLETGYMGIGLLGIIVIWSFWLSMRSVRLRKRNILKGVGFSAGMGGMQLMIHSSVDFNLQIPANAAFFMLLLSFAWLSVGYQQENRR